MYLSNYGGLLNECWQEIPAHFPQSVLHEYVIMPNHVHGIVEINDPQSTGTNMGMCTDIVGVGANDYSPLQRALSVTNAQMHRNEKTGAAQQPRPFILH